MKGAFVVVLGKGRSCTSMCLRHWCIHAPRAMTRNSLLFQGVATPPCAATSVLFTL
ncbi:MAG: hypothetical protein P8179_15360 [Candidatus Thiodiazotropha sp.]